MLRMIDQMTMLGVKKILCPVSESDRADVNACCYKKICPVTEGDRPDVSSRCHKRIISSWEGHRPKIKQHDLILNLTPENRE